MSVKCLRGSRAMFRLRTSVQRLLGCTVYSHQAEQKQNSITQINKLIN